MSALDCEIARVSDAVQRAAVRLDKLREAAAGRCCPSCVHGRGFTRLVDAQERRRAWLAILLEKRGNVGDGDLARCVREASWP